MIQLAVYNRADGPIEITQLHSNLQMKINYLVVAKFQRIVKVSKDNAKVLQTTIMPHDRRPERLRCRRDKQRKTKEERDE